MLSCARKPRRDISASALLTSRPQVLRLGTGAPVDPEVKTIAASWSAGISGTAPSASPPGPGTRSSYIKVSQLAGGRVVHSASVRQ